MSGSKIAERLRSERLDKPVCRADVFAVTLGKKPIPCPGIPCCECIGEWANKLADAIEAELNASNSMPLPEVLDADGAPIKVGDTVYTPQGKAYVVSRLDAPYVCHKEGFTRADYVTHRKHDTQEAIFDDSTMPPWDYLTKRAGFTSEQLAALNLEEAVQTMICHLLDRQRELDERKAR